MASRNRPAAGKNLSRRSLRLLRRALTSADPLNIRVNRRAFRLCLQMHPVVTRTCRLTHCPFSTVRVECSDTSMRSRELTSTQTIIPMGTQRTINPMQHKPLGRPMKSMAHHPPPDMHMNSFGIAIVIPGLVILLNFL